MASSRGPTRITFGISIHCPTQIPSTKPNVAPDIPLINRRTLVRDQPRRLPFPPTSLSIPTRPSSRTWSAATSRSKISRNSAPECQTTYTPSRVAVRVNSSMRQPCRSSCPRVIQLRQESPQFAGVCDMGVCQLFQPFLQLRKPERRGPFGLLAVVDRVFSSIRKSVSMREISSFAVVASVGTEIAPME